MFIFILFERAGILFESAFSLWVSLKDFFYFFKKHSALRNPICGQLNYMEWVPFFKANKQTNKTINKILNQFLRKVKEW